MTLFKASLCALAVLSSLAAAAGDYDRYYQDLPISLEQPAQPRIPDRTVRLTDYGAAGDGVTLCTEAFAKAIDALAGEGGGHLVVPAGVWLTGPIVLKSCIDLHLDQGAIIVMTPDKRLHFSSGVYEGRADSGIYAEKCHDISITGDGIIDGNGKYWRYAKRDKMSDTEWKDLLKLGGSVQDDGKLWFPDHLKHFKDLTDSPEAEEALRAHLIIIKRCERVLMQGVTIQNSPRFHVNPTRCEDVILDGITVRCPWNAQNGDGIDIGNSQRVLVVNCRVDVGDDGICMKGGSGESGLKAGPCRDILIRDNIVFHAHGGFVIGSDYSGGMEKIVVKDCSFSGTDTGLRFKSAPDRGGVTRDIYISDITMNDIREAAVTFQCDYSDVTYKDPGAAKVQDFMPDFSDIHISRVVCRECALGVVAAGIPGIKAIHDVTLTDCVFFHTGEATSIDTATADVRMENVRFFTF
ncbi:MAG: glycoside hydrolase family 28 protein [Bacteroidales bacterium]|nr:glycoside hydrolase family 28 protein [Bacteroidales bacterium]